MSTATRLNTNMSGWAPEARHYQVDGGHLVVVAYSFLTATGTDVFWADARGGAVSMTALIGFPAGTDSAAALDALGYDTVIDTIGDPVPATPPVTPSATEQSVIDMLPPQLAQAVETALQTQTPQTPTE